MEERVEWEEPSQLLANGLLPNAGPLIRILDSERWLEAEERTAELISCIQPNQPSEERRSAVTDYVQRLIKKCFPCQVFTFGSVPLKTYLPDGDIDLTAFSSNQSLKDSWALQVRDVLEMEEKNENAEFRVKEVQYIQAEVKIIKCLVENVVVDISFNQLGGLCTLCFLEEVDHLINNDHLFKRSVILIKAWCYYESRILGAHHGLLSTYALETLVLYIFHFFNNSFTGPLEVLYRFLEFFSNFDWENFCISLWGPVPVSSLPDVTAEPPRKDSGELLLSKLFLDACSSVYAVFPSGQENQGQPFISKHFNIIDPLRVNNNLGRSVSKGNFFRIRSAFAFGAERLARLLKSPKENLTYGLNQFFLNTWERHGSGRRPDIPGSNLWDSRLPTTANLPESKNLENNANVMNANNSSSGFKVEGNICGSHASLNHGYDFSRSMSRASDSSMDSHTRRGNSHGNSKSSRISGEVARETSSNQGVYAAKVQRNTNPGSCTNEGKEQFVFAQTHSSPELSDSYGDVSSQGKRNRHPQAVKLQPSSPRQESSYRSTSLELGCVSDDCMISSSDNYSSVKLVPTPGPDASIDSGGLSNGFHHCSSLDALNEEPSSAKTRGMHQEEQDVGNMPPSILDHGINGQDQIPFSLASVHMPFTVSPPLTASMGYGYGQQNIPALIPAKIPLMDPSLSGLQFPRGLVPPWTNNSGTGLSSISEDPVKRNQASCGYVEVNAGELDDDFQQDCDVAFTGGFKSDSGNLGKNSSYNKQQPASSSYNFTLPSSSGGSSNMGVEQKHSEEIHDTALSHDNQFGEISVEEKAASTMYSSTAYGSFLRSRTSSESSWNGSSAKGSELIRDNQGKKVAEEQSIGHGKDQSKSEHEYSQTEDDDQESSPSKMGSEIVEESTASQSAVPPHVFRHHMPVYEVQTRGSNSLSPITPMLIGAGSGHRIAFYPTGPPVPFLTMLPLPYIAPETENCDASTRNFGEDGLNSSDPTLNFDPLEGLDQSVDLNSSSSFEGAISAEAPENHKTDILNGDFSSHWQNLQYGRCCQNPQQHGPLMYPSPATVPPVYQQGRFPWDGLGRPTSASTNLLTQLTSYGPRLVPVAPLQSASSRPPNIFPQYNGVNAPRSRTGTGTYLPNHNMSMQDRQSPNARRGYYHYERNENHEEREGNWNASMKSRRRNRNRNQLEKSNSRLDRLASGDTGSERSSNPHNHDLMTSYRPQNGALRMNSCQNGPPNMYGMYPLTAMNHNAMLSNGPFVMLYPFDQSIHYDSPGTQLEFGSLGPVGALGINEQSHAGEGSHQRGTFEKYRFRGESEDPY